MLLKELVIESEILELKTRIREVLAESINDYLAVTLAQLKNKKPSELFNGSKPLVNLETLASLIAGLKVLSNREYRSAMTRQDLGINPNSAKELYKLLDDVAKDGNNPKDVLAIFNALKMMAPTVYKKEFAELENLKSEDESDRKEAITKLTAFMSKAGQMFGKLKSVAQSGKEELRV